MFRIQTKWSTSMVKIRRSKTQVQNSDKTALVKMRISADIWFRIETKWSAALVKIRRKIRHVFRIQTKSSLVLVKIRSKLDM